MGVDSRQNSRSKESLAESEAIGHTCIVPEDLLGGQADSMPSPSHRWFKDQSLPGLRQKINGSVVENPIQDFLRSAAFDESAPYLVKKDVMATYVKSCAGYCIITYLLVRLACIFQKHMFLTINSNQFCGFFRESGIAISIICCFIRTAICCTAISPLYWGKTRKPICP